MKICGLTMAQESEFRKFVQADLSNKYDMQIKLHDEPIVDSQDRIVESFKIRFLINDSKCQWVENKISADVHRYLYENHLNLVLSPVIEKTVWLGEVRYGLVYTKGGEQCKCEDCKYKCKRGNPSDYIWCDYFEAIEE